MGGVGLAKIEQLNHGEGEIMEYYALFLLCLPNQSLELRKELSQAKAQSCFFSLAP